MATADRQRCPYCRSMDIEQTLGNYAARTVSRTAGYAAGITLACAGSLFTMGKYADKIARSVATNVIDPITEVIPKRYRCKSCGKEFE